MSLGSLLEGNQNQTYAPILYQNSTIMSTQVVTSPVHIYDVDTLASLVSNILYTGYDGRISLRWLFQ